MLRNRYKGWSVLLKLKRNTTENHLPDIKLALRRSSVNFRSYLIIFKNSCFNRYNKSIYPYLYLSDQFEIFTSNECVSCYDAKPKILAEPCGHLSFCMQCHADWANQDGSTDESGKQICASCQSIVYRYSVKL